jgi:hypothetical protein
MNRCDTHRRDTLRAPSSDILVEFIGHVNIGSNDQRRRTCPSCAVLLIVVVLIQVIQFKDRLMQNELDNGQDRRATWQQSDAGGTSGSPSANSSCVVDTAALLHISDATCRRRSIDRDTIGSTTGTSKEILQWKRAFDHSEQQREQLSEENQVPIENMADAFERRISSRSFSDNVLTKNGTRRN